MFRSTTGEMLKKGKKKKEKENTNRQEMCMWRMTEFLETFPQLFSYSLI